MGCGGGCPPNEFLIQPVIRTIVKTANARIIVITGDASLIFPFYLAGVAAKIFCDLVLELELVLLAVLTL